MKLTKYGHACTRLEKNGRAVVIDPGELSPQPEAIAGVEAVFVTHQHMDHYSPERLRAAMNASPDLVVYTCPEVASDLTDLGEAVHVVADGDRFEVAGFDVTVAGEKHQHHHPDFPPCDNVGFGFDDEVFYPGDALTLASYPTLLLPGQGPWLTTPMLIEYLRRFAPRRAFAVHDGLVNEWGLMLLDGILASESERAGLEYRRPAVGETISL